MSYKERREPPIGPVPLDARLVFDHSEWLKPLDELDGISLFADGKMSRSADFNFGERRARETLPHKPMRRAVRQMTAFYGDAWQHNPVLVLNKGDAFEASIACNGGLVLHFSTGCIDALEHLQAATSVDFDIGVAVEWLILHELHHADLGHFEMMRGVPMLNLVARAETQPVCLDVVPKEEWPKIAPCLELQADHDAMEMMLGSFNGSRAIELRELVASIIAVIVLIERADAGRGADLNTHPKAATRVFQLLGHVSEMWAISTQVNGVPLPPEQQIQAFSKDVILPAYFDAISLAKAAGADTITADLGTPEAFFADIASAKLGQWDALITSGAQEWASLKSVNERLLPLLPHYLAST